MVFDEKSFRNELGRRLQNYRQEKGFTLDAAVTAAVLDISRSTLSAIENGVQDISAKDLYALSTVYKFSLDRLIDEIVQELLSQKYSINLNR